MCSRGVVALRDFDAYAMVRGGPRRVAVFFAVAANPLSGVLKAQRKHRLQSCQTS